MKMAALKFSLMALTALLTFSICSAAKVKPGQIVAGPVPDTAPAPAPFGPVPSGPVPVTSPAPAPSGPVPVQAPAPGGPVPDPAMEARTSAYLVKPPVKMNSEAASSVDENEVGTNCAGGGWGCGGGGMPGCGGYGCGGCPPAAPKNPYFCQPEANCVGSPGYGSGNGFTIYLGDHFPSSDSGDQLKS